MAELYDPLVSDPARADQYASFLDACGTPALELACGSGHPMLELMERGYDVEGLDSSADMLELCRSRGSERGLTPSLHLGLMQSFELPKRFRSIFLAGASFTLLTSDRDAAGALSNIHAHLEPGGHALIPIERVDIVQTRQLLGLQREAAGPDGDLLRVRMVALDEDADGEGASLRLLYERISADGSVSSVERNWRRRWWTQRRFGEMLLAAGFAKTALLDEAGGAAAPDASTFVALAQRS